jgi:hypothetical protein
MTENYVPASTPQRGVPLPPARAEEQGTSDVAKDQAADLGHSSIQAGKHLADVAREEASGVAAEAGRQGRDMLRQAQDQLGQQAAQGQQRLADRLLSLSDELSSMADGSSQGMAADLARQAASRARDTGQWLGDRKPARVVDEVQSFARRRPGAFLALAAGAGLVAGRLTRGMKAASGDDPASAAPAAPDAMADPSRRWAQPPGEPANQAGAAAGVGVDAGAAAGALPATGGPPASGTDRSYAGRSVLADNRTDGRNLP